MISLPAGFKHLGRVLRSFLVVVITILSLTVTALVQAQDGFLQQMEYNALPDGRIQVRFGFDVPPPLPKSYLSGERQLVLDFLGIEHDLTFKKKKFREGRLERLNFSQAPGQLRVTATLTEKSHYRVFSDGNSLYLELAATLKHFQDADLKARNKAEKVTLIRAINYEQVGEISRVKILLSDDQAGVDIIEEGNNVLVNLVGARLSDRMDKRIELRDFQSLLMFIDSMGGKSHSSILIKPGPEPYEFKAYQLANTIVLDFVAEMIGVDDDERDPALQIYTGKPMDMSIQQGKRRAVLQKVADTAGRNLVVTDSVDDLVSLRLHNVPWDQALELVLRDTGLQTRMLGDIILVAYPTDLDEVERIERQKIELARLRAKQKREQEAKSPQLRTEFLQLVFTTPKRIVEMLRSEKLISSIGFVRADEEHNIIELRETEQALERIRQRVTELDRKADQVLVQALLVMADHEISRKIGLRWSDQTMLSGNQQQAMAVGFAPGRFESLKAQLSELKKQGSVLLVSEPKILTPDGRVATLEAGRELPFKATNNSTMTGVFSDVVVSLEVKPRVSKGDRVALDMMMQQSSLSIGSTRGGVNVKDSEMRTSMVIADRQTLVLGGVFNSADNAGNTLQMRHGGLPVLGNLFRNTQNSMQKTELLIFISPTLVRGNFGNN